MALAFKYASSCILSILTGADGERVVAAFSQISPWRRIFSLFAGGLLAGIVLLFAAKK